jgi:hypothetical protein
MMGLTMYRKNHTRATKVHFAREPRPLRHANWLDGIPVASAVDMGITKLSRALKIARYEKPSPLRCRRRFALLCSLIFSLSSIAMKADTVFEGGENGLSNVTVQTDGANAGLNVLSTRFVADTTPHSFRLILDGFSMQDESVMLNTRVTIGATSEVRFKSMLGQTGDGEIANVQVSTSTAVIPPESSWVTVYSQRGTGQTVYETAFLQKTVSLAAFAGQTLRVRFLYHLEPGRNWFWQDWEHAGWFLDQIELRGTSASVIEGGENGLANVTVQTDGVNVGVNVLSTRFAADTMPHSFRLILDGVSMQDESVMLNTRVTVGATSEVRFKSMLGQTGDGEIANVQVSTSTSAVPPESSWVNLYSQRGTGQTVYETAFSQKTVSLATFAGQALRVRFIYHLEPGKNWFWQDWEHAGWFFDQIEVTNITIGGGVPVGHAPVAQNGTLAVTEDIAKSSTLSATDVDGDALSYSIVAQGSKGVVAIINAATGTFAYTPNANANGSDSFTFKATDTGALASNVATVTVAISAVNDAPVSQNGTLAVIEDVAQTGTVLGTDADGDALSYSIVAQGAKGTAVISNIATGAFIYTPNPNANGADSFTFKVSDTGGLVSSVSTVAVTIAAVNDAPVITSNGGGASASISVAENSTAVTTIIATDADAGSTLSYTIVGGADASKFVINGGSLVFISAPNFESPTDVGGNNIYDVTVQVSDGSLTDNQVIAVSVYDVSESTPGALTVVIQPINGGHITDEVGNELLGQITKILGTTCILTATPAPGFVFAGWGDGIEVTPENSRTVSFTMPQSLNVTAKFVAVGGNYEGLVQAGERADQTYESSGRLQITLGSLGNYTGKLKLAAETYSFDGAINADGVIGIGVSKMPSNVTLNLTVSLDVDGVPRISGTVSRALGFISTVNAPLEVFTNALNPTAPYRNVPASLIAAYTYSVSVPNEQGNGTGRLVVRDTGNVSVYVTMPDGTRKLDSSVLQQDSQGFKVSIFVPFLQNQGSVCGVVRLPQLSTEAVSGEIIWFKPANPNYAANPAGWPAGMDLPIVGSRYEPPSATSSGMVAVAPAVEYALKSRLTTVILSGGGIPEALEIPTLIANNEFVPLPGSPLRRFSLSINPRNGKLTGEFKHPVTRKSNRIKGVVLQLQKIGVGYFLGTLESGAVEFSRN